MTPEEENIIAHNILIYVQSILRSDLQDASYFISPTPAHEKNVREIVKEAKDYAEKSIDKFVEWTMINYIGYSTSNDLRQIADNYKNELAKFPRKIKP